jgi:hypothetical protein
VDEKVGIDHLFSAFNFMPGLRELCLCRCCSFGKVLTLLDQPILEIIGASWKFEKVNINVCEQATALHVVWLKPFVDQG